MNKYIMIMGRDTAIAFLKNRIRRMSAAAKDSKTIAFCATKNAQRSLKKILKAPEQNVWHISLMCEIIDIAA